ncbi:DUF3887 domain-containing protein [Hydrogenoanaerobacterium sp.]|uniref:alpha/beta hydrolase n=1 Tax=Hydrogenoanaerobacterium sp. TaxID=2953763 RepID=UPI0028A29133|nr:DUF3887 domain-containing protein [Hydrogenoanaerobacterium sp.]
MKKLWAMILAALLTIGMAACGSASFDEQAIRQIASQSVDEIVAGDYDKVVAKMSTACAAKLPAETLRQAWGLVTTPVGTFVKQTGAEVKVEGSKATVIVTSEYTSKELVATFTFNRKNQIEGLWINYGKVIEQPLENSEKFEEIRLEIGSGATKLSGKLTLPKGVEKPPVVVMLQGSGSTDLDETVGKAANKPFRDIAHGLAEQGIASIRYNKRFFTYPEEAQNLANTLTVEDEVIKDATDAIELAEVDTRVDNNRIYLLGHSMGGMLAPKIAYDNQTVRGIISMAGSLRGMEDILLDQNLAAINESNISESEKAKRVQALEKEYKKIKELTDADAKKSVTVFGQPASYWVSLNRAKGIAYAPNLNIPMLVLQGDADFQVSVEKDYQSWRDALAGKQNVTYWVYGGLNHLFMPTTGVKDTTDYDSPAHVEQKVIDDIAAWIKTH